VTGADATSSPDGLRAVAVDPTAMRALAAEVEAAAHAEQDPGRRAQLLGRAGYLAGVLRELDRAERLLTAALDLASASDHARRVVVLRLRLADVHALGGDPVRAERELTDLLDACVADDTAELRHFVLQHRGKARVELGDVDGALDDLTAARTIRLQLDDDDLVASTDAAIAAVQRPAAR
jgi:tetratricopeptide (TPR) repeat protein